MAEGTDAVIDAPIKQPDPPREPVHPAERHAADARAIP